MNPNNEPRTPLGRGTTEKRGLLVVYTGNGKGKSTAAFGVLMRAWGRGMKVCAVQFLKAETASFGEHKAATKMGIDMFSSGDGFTWLSKDLDETAAKAQHGWEIAKDKIVHGGYDVVLLDEMTYVLNYGWVDFAAMQAWLDVHKPAQQHIIITGREASPALIDYADLVTEMQEIKHPFQMGMKAQAGLDF